MLCLPKPELVSVNLPFSGFYESEWSNLVDDEETGYVEHVEEEPGRYSPGIVHAQKEGNLYEILADNSKYRQAYITIAQEYAEAYLWAVAADLGFPVTVIETPYESTVTPGYRWVNRRPVMPVAWQWEELVSPAYYNFATDRIFAKVDAVLLRELYRQVMLVDNSWAFDRAVKDMFTSYDGFCSFYDNDPSGLKAKPLEDWDHNELLVLFRAWHRLRDKDDQVTWGIYEDMSSNNSYWGNCVNWDKVEEDAAALLLEWQEENGVEPEDRPYRCPDTLELPL